MDCSGLYGSFFGMPGVNGSFLVGGSFFGESKNDPEGGFCPENKLLPYTTGRSGPLGRFSVCPWIIPFPWYIYTLKSTHPGCTLLLNTPTLLDVSCL